MTRIFQLLVPVLAMIELSPPVIAAENPKGYHIAVQIDHCSDSLIFLNHYWSNKTELDDTARRNQSGGYVFDGNTSLDQGLYFISGQNGKHYIDFIIASGQSFKLEFDRADPLGKAISIGSPENTAFFRVLSTFRSLLADGRHPETDSAGFVLSHADFSKPAFRTLLDFLDRDSSFCSRFIYASINPVDFQQYFSPEKRKREGSPALIFLEHYFDNVDFSDSRLINTPILSKRIDDFLDTISKLPGISVQAEIDHLLELSNRNPLTCQFVAWYLITHFETYYFVEGNDALFVHVVNDYLEKGKIGWYFPELRERELKQLHTFEPLLNGKPAPGLEMPDSSNFNHDLYNLKSKYTLLLFWASTCSHCRDEMPSILSFYKEFHTKYNLEIFAVSTDTSVTRWKSYIRRHNLPWVNVFGRKSIRGSYHQLYDIRSTPVVYLLDENKIIQSKYITPEKAAILIRQREDSRKP